jgi:hypothetical protein
MWQTIDHHCEEGYRLQPIHVDDLAKLAVEQGEATENQILSQPRPPFVIHSRCVQPLQPRAALVYNQEWMNSSRYYTVSVSNESNPSLLTSLDLDVEYTLAAGERGRKEKARHAIVRIGGRW